MSLQSEKSDNDQQQLAQNVIMTEKLKNKGDKSTCRYFGLFKDLFSVLFCCNTCKGQTGCSCIYWNVCSLIYFVLSFKGSGIEWVCRMFWGREKKKRDIYQPLGFVHFFSVFQSALNCTTQHNIKLSPHIQCRDKRVKSAFKFYSIAFKCATQCLLGRLNYFMNDKMPN